MCRKLKLRECEGHNLLVLKTSKTKMSALPAKQETLLRWLMMDLKTKSVPFESSNRKVDCFTGTDAANSLLNRQGLKFCKKIL